MVQLRRPLVPALPVLLLLVSLPAGATVFEITAGGGDCVLLGGFWVESNQTCILLGVTIPFGDTLRVVSVKAQFSGVTSNQGTIDNLGQVRVLGALTSRGTIVNQSDWRVENRLINSPGGLVQNQAFATMTIEPGALVLNEAGFINAGTIAITSDDLPFEEGLFENVATLANQSVIDGGATAGLAGGRLLNLDTVNNSTGLIRNATVENFGEIDGGTIDDAGSALGQIVNRPGGILTGVTTENIAVDNSGTLEGYTVSGFGALFNRFSGVIEFAGGEVLALSNAGFVDVQGVFEILGGVTNEATGVFVNSSAILNEDTVDNHGLIENRGLWRNDGAAPGEGKLDNFGTLLNFDTVISCISAPDVEEVNNFGTLSNSGTITSCGATNGGTWYECGNGGTPAGNPVVSTVDTDLDGVCDGADCAGTDGNAWQIPGAVPTLALDRPAPAAAVELEWTEPAYLGGTSVVYDVIGSTLSDDFLAAGTCLVSAVAGLSATDATPVPPGQALYLLVRASGCSGGNGGVDSSGAARPLPACP